MADEAIVRNDGLRLLWAMNEYQAGGRVGAQVHPGRAAHQAELTPDTARCDAAVAFLEGEGAIERDEQANELSWALEGSTYSFYRLTARAPEMLRGYSPE